MGLLSELVSRLDQKEIQQVEQKGLTDTERQLFDLEVSQLGQEVDYSVLQFSASHLRKLQSTVYDKILHSLRPESEADRLQFFSDKLLYAHTMHWVTKVEKRLKKTNELEELRSMYAKAARLLPNGEISGFDTSFMERIEQSFQELFPEDSINQQLIALHKIHMTGTIIREAPGKLSIEDHLLDIEASKQKAAELNHPLVYFWTYYNVINSAPYLESVDAAEIRDKVDALVAKSGDSIPKEDYIFFLVNQVDHDYVSSRFEQAYAGIEKLYAKYPEVLDHKLYWADVYSQLCIKLGYFEKARQLQIKAHKVTIDPAGNKGSSHFAPYAYFALMDLMEGNFDRAFKAIQFCQQEIKKAHFFWLDAMIKILENTYFHLTRDYVLADDLAAKHIKFYNYHKDKPDTQIFKDFHNIIRFCARQTDPGAVLPDAYLNSFHEWQKGDLAFIGQLLSKVLEINKVDLPTTS